MKSLLFTLIFLFSSSYGSFLYGEHEKVLIEAIKKNQSYSQLRQILEKHENIEVFKQTSQNQSVAFWALKKDKKLFYDLVTHQKERDMFKIRNSSPMQENYLYDVRSPQGKKAYFFGTNHHYPFHKLQKHIKKILLSPGTRILEIDMSRMKSSELGSKFEGIDYQVFSQARKKNLLLGSLETEEEITPYLKRKLSDKKRQTTFEERIKSLAYNRLLLNAPSEEESFLRRVVREEKEEYKKAIREYSDLNTLYSTNKLGLEKFLTSSIRKYSPAQQKSHYRHQEIWMPRIYQFIERHQASSGKLIFIVGASHLLGEGSILKVLESKGYTIREHSFFKD